MAQIHLNNRAILAQLVVEHNDAVGHELLGELLWCPDAIAQIIHQYASVGDMSKVFFGSGWGPPPNPVCVEWASKHGRHADGRRDGMRISLHLGIIYASGSSNSIWLRIMSRMGCFQIKVTDHEVWKYLQDGEFPICADGRNSRITEWVKSQVASTGCRSAQYRRIATRLMTSLRGRVLCEAAKCGIPLRLAANTSIVPAAMPIALSDAHTP